MSEFGSSYEAKTRFKFGQDKLLPKKLDIGVIKYFWQASPFTPSNLNSVAKFLKDIEVLKKFTNNELRILSRYLHHRKFEDQEIIFKQNDPGFGFYFIYSGRTDIIVDDENAEISDKAKYILSLEKYDCFGELALLQENSQRSATVIAKDYCEVLGIFKPDLDEMINDYPVVAAKLLHSVSVIIANRLFSITKEVQFLKNQLVTLENANAQLQSKES